MSYESWQYDRAALGDLQPSKMPLRALGCPVRHLITDAEGSISYAVSLLIGRNMRAERNLIAQRIKGFAPAVCHAQQAMFTPWLRCLCSYSHSGVGMAQILRHCVGSSSGSLQHYIQNGSGF